MKVQEVLLDGNKTRYMLLDSNGIPIIPVTKYLKHIDNIGRSRNTQKTYCYSLKLYFEYLEQIKNEFDKISIADLSDFVIWLRNPFENNNIISAVKIKAKRRESTINTIVTVVTNFYDYLYRSELIKTDLYSGLMKQNNYVRNRRYKGFLYHTNRNKSIKKNILKVKVPRKKLTILSMEEIKKLYDACSNIRDKFLLRLLFETGLRIGEALSLHIEDFIYDHLNGHKIKLRDRGELENGSKLKSGERDIFISQELIDMFDDYEYTVLDELELDSNFVFVKLKGKNKGKPLNYQDVDSLFKRLRRKTSINVHPHLFRHTHATSYYIVTKDIKALQERLGHAQIQTTMNIYLHPSDEEIRESWQVAEKVFIDSFKNN